MIFSLIIFFCHLRVNFQIFNLMKMKNIFLFFYKGKRLWEARSAFFSNTWNFYHPMALPDFNGDGVKEIAVMHGGNPTKDSNVRIKTYTVKIEICRSIKNKKN